MTKTRERPSLLGADARPTDVLKIEFDVRDIKACEQAVGTLQLAIRFYHGSAMANKIFAVAAKPTSKRELNRLKNGRLLAAMSSYNSDDVEEEARRLVEKNNTLPLDQRYGPSGTDRASTMATHIRRLMAKYTFKTIERKDGSTYVEMTYVGTRNRNE